MVKITFVIKNLLSTYYTFGIIAKRANKSLDKVSYCGNNDDGFGVGAMLIIIGLVMFYNSLKNLKIKRLIENVPTSKARSVAMGLVELKGKIENRNKTLTDPFDGKDCVYWHIHIQQYMKRGKRRTWVTRHKAKKQVPFYLTDQTGSVLVNMQGANSKNVKRDNEYESAMFFSDDIPSKVEDYCNKENVKLRGWLGGKKRMRFRVTYLEPNDDIYIIGSARSPHLDEANGLKKITAVIDKSKDGIFILSDKSEKELIDDYGGQSWIIPLGITLSGIGLSLILKSTGVF